MQKTIIGVLALLLASVLVGVTQNQNKNSPDKQHEGPNNQKEKRETFKMTRIGEKIGLDGAHLAFRTLEGSSGSIVVVTYGTLTSPDKATTELHLWSQSAKNSYKMNRKRTQSAR